MWWNATLVIVNVRKWKRALDKGENACTMFIDLSKAFDIINHDLLRNYSKDLRQANKQQLNSNSNKQQFQFI